MKLIISIDFNNKMPKEATIADNQVHLSFNSFESYLEYLNNPTPIEFNQPTLTPTERKKIQIVSQKINSNLLKLTKLLNQETLNVYHITKNDISNIPNQPLIIDLTDMDYEDTKTFINSRDWSNALFQDRFNRVHNLTTDEIRITYQRIDAMINKIKTFNPSPAEAAFICFDVARSRIYNKQNIEDASIPRDLSCVLAQDKIVCSGFANLFCCLCNALGVYAEITNWEPVVEDNPGHDSCLAFIKDPKYDINGIYAFEPTWNSKKNSNDQSYLLSSKGSFIPFEKEVAEKNNVNLFFCGSSIYGTLKHRILTLARLKELKCPEQILNHQEYLAIEALKKVYKKLGRRAPRINSNDKLKSLKGIIYKLENKFDNTIPLDTFRNLIENAREIEHTIDPSYPQTLKPLLLTSHSYELENKATAILKKILAQNIC